MKLIIDVPGMDATDLAEIQSAVNKTITWTTGYNTFRFDAKPTSGLAAKPTFGPAAKPTFGPAAKPTFRSFAITSVKKYMGYL